MDSIVKDYNIEILQARTKDAFQASCRDSTVRFIGFIDSTLALTVVKTAKSQGAGYKIFGGYDFLDRVVIGVFEEGYEKTQDIEFPIATLEFTFRKEYSLSHRDFLGSLMALGIERSTIGDILVSKGKAIVFVLKDMAGFILSQITKVGSVGVEVKIINPENITIQQQFSEFSDVVASLRLDCVIADLARCGRKKATDLINNGFVSINSITVKQTTRHLKTGDKISIRQVGKFLIEDISAVTKKGRIVLNYKKYL